MVPISQFHLRKDYYVGIKLIFFDVLDRTIDPMKINQCIIHGYTDRDTLNNRPTENFGEGDCKAFPLKDMKSINSLIDLFNK